jgi:hypothetical protein
LPGLERVSLISQLRTQPSNEKSCAAPQPWLRAGQGLCTQHPRMMTKPVTWRSEPKTFRQSFKGQTFTIGTTAECVGRGPSSVAFWSSLTGQATLVMDLQQVDVLWIFFSLITRRMCRDHRFSSNRFISGVFVASLLPCFLAYITAKSPSCRYDAGFSIQLQHN